MNQRRPHAPLALAALWSLLAGIGSCHVAAGLDDLEVEEPPTIEAVCDAYCDAAKPYPACEALGCDRELCINGLGWNSFVWCKPQILGYGACVTQADPSSIRCESGLLQPNEGTCSAATEAYAVCLFGPGDNAAQACVAACEDVFVRECDVERTECIDYCVVTVAQSGPCQGPASALVHCAAANPGSAWTCGEDGLFAPDGLTHPCLATYFVLVACVGQ